MKKNGFVEGAFIATFSIVICKIIGLIYVIPFYAIIGSKGGALYSYAYSIYAMFLSLSTCGVPVAISKSISEFNALGYEDAKKRTYKIGTIAILILSITCFLILMIFAPQIAHLMIGDIKGGNTIENVSTAIRIVSVAVVVAPLLSVTRGYLQGHKIITPSSVSTVIEQIVRVVVLILGSFLIVKVFNLPVDYAVYLALFAASVGALGALIYLKFKIKKNKNVIECNLNVKEPKFTTKDLVKKVIFYALPFVMIDFIRSAYGMVDSFTVVKTMTSLGYDAVVTESSIGILATWASKLNMIVASVAMGMVISLIPNISAAFVKKDMTEVNRKINQAFKILTFIVLPMAVGLSFLAQPVWTIFYGADALGTNIFRIYILQSIVYCAYTISLNLVQCMNNTKFALSALIGSFLLKAVLNGPFMRLIYSIGIDAYYGPIILNILVQGVASIFLIIALKKKYDFKFKKSLITIGKTLLCVGAMLIALILLQFIVPLNQTSKIMSIIIVVPFTLVGMFVYFICCKKLGCFKDVFNENSITKIVKNFVGKGNKNEI